MARPPGFRQTHDVIITKLAGTDDMQTLEIALDRIRRVVDVPPVNTATGTMTLSFPLWLTVENIRLNIGPCFTVEEA